MKIPADLLPGCALILDEYLVRKVYDIRSTHGNPPHDEVWEGFLILKPLPDDEHQCIQTELLFALADAGVQGIRPGVNISDRNADWMGNFRCPDVVAYHGSHTAINRETHWQGGPDFLVEIVMPNDLARDKLPFYAKVNTREVMIVDRDPWALELYQLISGTSATRGPIGPRDPRGAGERRPAADLPASGRVAAASDHRHAHGNRADVEGLMEERLTLARPSRNQTNSPPSD
jgi:Uma2 family endonuclease